MNNCKEIKHYIKNNELDLEKIINEYSSYTATIIDNMAKNNLNDEDKEQKISEFSVKQRLYRIRNRIRKEGK